MPLWFVRVITSSRDQLIAAAVRPSA